MHQSTMFWIMSQKLLAGESEKELNAYAVAKALGDASSRRDEPEFESLDPEIRKRLAQALIKKQGQVVNCQPRYFSLLADLGYRDEEVKKLIERRRRVFMWKGKTFVECARMFALNFIK